MFAKTKEAPTIRPDVAINTISRIYPLIAKGEPGTFLGELDALLLKIDRGLNDRDALRLKELLDLYQWNNQMAQTRLEYLQQPGKLKPALQALLDPPRVFGDNL
jgi:hypothetical protein